MGVAQIKKNRLAGRPKAFRTSVGIAGDFLGKRPSRQTQEAL
jgi:hypothetical protein